MHHRKFSAKDLLSMVTRHLQGSVICVSYTVVWTVIGGKHKRWWHKVPMLRFIFTARLALHVVCCPQCMRRPGAAIHVNIKHTTTNTWDTHAETTLSGSTNAASFQACAQPACPRRILGPKLGACPGAGRWDAGASTHLSSCDDAC